MAVPASFHDVVFPDSIAQDAVGGPKFKTTIFDPKGGRDRRNIDWSIARGEWDVAHAVKSETEFQALLAFFYARYGQGYSFKFHDWADDYATLQTLGTGTGSLTQFQCKKLYTSGAYTYTRTLTKINPSTSASFWDGETNPWSVTVNSVVKEEGVDYTVNYNLGVITFVAGHLPANGHLVKASFEFYCHCRFGVDHMKASMKFYDNHTWGQITIVEEKDDEELLV